MKWLGLLLVGAAAIGVGCTGGSLRSRSAGDLACPAEDLKIYQLDGRSYRVIGCGRQAVYIEVCDRPGALDSRCTWHLDSTASQSPPGSPPAPASVAAPASTGCSYDAQCKGERVCSHGECIAPAAPPATQPASAVLTPPAPPSPLPPPATKAAAAPEGLLGDAPKKCAKGTLACGGGLGGTCCPPNKKCCSGGIANSYLCWSGNSCPALP